MKTNSLSKSVLICMAMFTISSFAHSKNLPSSIKEESVTYMADGVTLKGFVTYDESIKGKRPAILIVHEWWGLNDYPKMRARKLAELGYIAMAVDMYGNGKIAANPTEAQDFTMPFYKEPLLVKSRLDAAIKKIKEYAQTDPDNIAAIGYCFGGFVVLNSAKLGKEFNMPIEYNAEADRDSWNDMKTFFSRIFKQ